MTVAIVARAAISGLGSGVGSLAPQRAGEVASVCIAPDAELIEAGLQRPNASRVSALDAMAPAAAGPDRAAQLLGAALVALTSSLDASRAGWRTGRLGLALGTSSGGMHSIELLFRARAAGEAVSPDLGRRATYFGPVAPALAAAGLELAQFDERVHLLAACAASTMAVGIAMRWLERDAVDLVVAGGYDALSLLVAAGFEAIRATTAATPRPFRRGRDGMSLGEGAGLVALVRADRASVLDEHSPAVTRWFVHGFGAATDAVHITAPDRTGDGLARAAERALADAGARAADVALVSAHATATPFNDAMEAQAIRRVLPGEVVVQPLKAQIGHTLGAAGILETLAATTCIERGLLPGAAGDGELDPDSAVKLLHTAAPLADLGLNNPLVLKLSAAFGGANAALVLGTSPRSGRPARVTRPVALGPRARVLGAQAARAALHGAGIPVERLAKLDSLSLLVCGAVAELAVLGASLADAAIVVGHSLATLDIDERFFSRILSRGGGHAEPRLFPATSPNVCAGHAAILFGLRGPSAAVSGGLCGGVEALALAAELVASGDANGAVVVAVDEIAGAGEAVLAAGFPGREPLPVGALAVWLGVRNERGVGAIEVPLGIRPDHDGRLIGHLALEACLADLEARGTR